MGRKSFQELNQSQLLNNNELEEYLPSEFNSMSDEQKNELALSLYQFAKLIYDFAK